MPAKWHGFYAIDPFDVRSAHSGADRWHSVFAKDVRHGVLRYERKLARSRQSRYWNSFGPAGTALDIHVPSDLVHGGVKISGHEKSSAKMIG